MNQQEADQDVVDEVSEEVDSKGKVMRSEKNDWQFLRRSELVDGTDSMHRLNQLKFHTLIVIFKLTSCHCHCHRPVACSVCLWILKCVLSSLYTKT